MANMKRLYEAVTEIDRFSRSQPLDIERLDSLFDSVHQVAIHGNAGFSLLLDTLFPPHR